MKGESCRSFIEKTPRQPSSGAWSLMEGPRHCHQYKRSAGEKVGKVGYSLSDEMECELNQLVNVF